CRFRRFLLRRSFELQLELSDTLLKKVRNASRSSAWTENQQCHSINCLPFVLSRVERLRDDFRATPLVIRRPGLHRPASGTTVGFFDNAPECCVDSPGVLR